MIKGVKLFACLGMLCLLTVSTAFAGQATMTSPADNATLSALQTFSWDRNGQDAGYIFIGTTVGGKQYKAYFTDNDSSITVPGLPFDNSTVYVRLYSRNAGVWTYIDYTYKARTGSATDAAVMTTPANNGDDATPNFAWSAVTGAKYILRVGTTVGGNDVFQAGYPAGVTSANVSAIANYAVGTPIYVRLFTVIGRASSWVDYNYSTDMATMTTPANSGDVLGSPAQFAWTDDGASAYWLFIGSSQGAYDYKSAQVGTDLSLTVPGLPSDNSTVYVRLWARHGSKWVFNDYTYIANSTGSSDLAQITTPANDNDTLDNSTGCCVIGWDNATYADSYWLKVGSSVGASDYFAQSGITDLSACVPGLPSGTTVYVRLHTVVGKVQNYVDGYFKTP